MKNFGTICTYLELFYENSLLVRVVGILLLGVGLELSKGLLVECVLSQN